MGAGKGTIGRYRLVTKLGTGGTANVFLALLQAPQQLRKLVVLKVPHDDIALDPSLRAMFLDEARLAARLSHPNVVRTYEVLDEDDRSILVMEYVDGFSLAQILTEGRRSGRPLPLALHLRIISEVLLGLHYAHELRDCEGKPLGLVHRDISPQNILVTMDGQVKIVDFGIAKAANSSHVTAKGSFKGKIRYMPPEQLRGRPVDRRTDVFAVGAVLWDVVSGRPLWDRTPDINVMGALMGGNIPSAQQRPEICPRLASILDGALAFDPAARYPTAIALQFEIEAWLGATATDRRSQTEELGAFLRSMFADQHARRMRCVAETLGPGEILARTIEPPTSMGGLTVPSFAAQTPRTASLSPASVTTPPRGRRRRIPGAWVVVGAGAALCLFFAVALVREAIRPRRPAALGSSRIVAPPEPTSAIVPAASPPPSAHEVPPAARSAAVRKPGDAGVVAPRLPLPPPTGVPARASAIELRK